MDRNSSSVSNVQIFPELVAQIRVFPSGEYLRIEIVSVSGVRVRNFESRISKVSASTIKSRPREFPHTSRGLFRNSTNCWLVRIFLYMSIILYFFREAIFWTYRVCHEARRLFLGRFWPLLWRVSFFEAAGSVVEIGLSQNPNRHYES